MNNYLLQYWAYNPQEETDTVLRTKDVLVSQETIDMFLNGKDKQFFEFVIKDGEKMILNKNYIHSLTEDFIRRSDETDI